MMLSIHYDVLMRIQNLPSIFLMEVAQEKAWETWKRELINLLKDSPLTDCKILRWKAVQSYQPSISIHWAFEVVEAEELEVFPETSL